MTSPDAASYSSLITSNLEYIEKQCYKAFGLYKTELSGFAVDSKDTVTFGMQTRKFNEVTEEDADAFFNDMLDYLKADDFRVLRKFQGKSKITTYITAIISRGAIDLIRKRRGRSRARERAEALGDLGLKVYEAVFQRGYSTLEAYEHLKTAWGITEPLSRIEELAETIRGRQKATFEAPESGASWGNIRLRVMQDETGNLVVPASGGTPEDALMAAQKTRLAGTALAAVLSGLTGEERLLMRMRFPVGEEEAAKELKEISRILGITEKAADNRLRRILLKCREAMLRKGLALSDLVDL